MTGEEKIIVTLPAGAISTLNNLAAERVLGADREEIARHLLVGALLEHRRRAGKNHFTEGD